MITNLISKFMYIGVALSFCSNDTSAADEQSLLLVPLALVELKS